MKCLQSGLLEHSAGVLDKPSPILNTDKEKNFMEKTGKNNSLFNISKNVLALVS